MSFSSFLIKGVSKILGLTSRLPDYFRYCKYCKTIRNYNINPGVAFFSGNDTYVYGEGEFFVGANSYCGSRCGIYIEKGLNCNIGSNTAISHNVRIYTSNRNPIDVITGESEVSTVSGSVSIGDNCWVGANVFICQGVSIGDNVVIGANSVVSKNIPSNVIAAGAPIRIIKSV